MGLGLGLGSPISRPTYSSPMSLAPFFARWTPSFSILENNGVYSNTLDTSTLIPVSPTRTLYIQPQTGNDANNGTAIGTPYKTLLKALQQTTSGTSTLIYINATADTIWRGNNAAGLAGTVGTQLGWNNSLPLGDVYIVNNTPQWRIVTAAVSSTSALTWVNIAGTTAYRASITATTAGCVVDFDQTVTPVDPSGKPVPTTKKPFFVHKKMATEQECIDTPGSWWLDTASITVNRIDGRACDTRVLVCNRSGNGRAGSAASGQITYVDGIDFVGGSSAFKAQTIDSSTPITFIDRNCTFSGSDFSTTSNLITLLGPVTNYSWRAAECGGWADNRNGHSNSSDGTNAPSPFIFRDQAVSFGAGTTGITGGGQENTFTIHDGAAAISMNCLDYGSRGIPVAGGTNFSMHWMLGGSVGPASDNTITLFASGISDGIAWIDGTTLYAPNGYQVVTGGNALLHYRNISLPTHSGSSSDASITPY